MMDYSQAREAASRAAAAHTASAFQASLHHGSAGVVTRAQFERVVFDSAISRTLLNTETLRHLLRGGLNCVKLGTRSWARAYIGETLSRHVTALHWLADDEELRYLRRDLRVAPRHEDVPDALARVLPLHTHGPFAGVQMS